MKKIFVFLSLIICLIGLSSCGDRDKESEPNTPANNGNDTPTDDNDTPTNGNDTPTDDNDTPTNGNDTPTDDNDQDLKYVSQCKNGDAFLCNCYEANLDYTNKKATMLTATSACIKTDDNISCPDAAAELKNKCEKQKTKDKTYWLQYAECYCKTTSQRFLDLIIN